MFDCIKRYFSTGYWTSDAELQQIAYAQIGAGLQAANLDPQVAAVHDILNQIGWSRTQRYWFDPFRVRMQAVVRNAVATAFAARQLDAMRLLAQDGDLASYEKLSAKKEYQKYFTPKEFATISRVATLAPTIIRRDCFAKAATIEEKGKVLPNLFKEIERTGRPAQNTYEEAKNSLNRRCQLNQLGIDIDEEIFYSMYPDYLLNTVPNLKDRLNGIDPAICCQHFQRIFGEDLTFINQVLKRYFNKLIPLTDEQIQRMLNPFKVRIRAASPDLTENKVSGQATVALLKHLRWSATRDVYKEKKRYTHLFYLLKNDERANAVPRNLDAYVQFLEQHYPNLWDSLTIDSFHPELTEKAEKFKKRLAERMNGNQDPMWEVLLDSARSLPIGEIRVEVEYLEIFKAIGDSNDDARIRLNGTQARMDHLRNFCPTFYAYLRRKRPFTDAELDTELMKLQGEMLERNPAFTKLSDVEKLKQASLLFFSKIHAFDTRLSPLFAQLTADEVNQFLQPNPSEEIKKKKMQFAAEFEPIMDLYRTNYKDKPLLRFVVSEAELNVLRQGKRVVQQGARYYRECLRRIISNPEVQKRVLFNAVRDGASRLAEGGKKTVQLEKDFSRLDKTTIVRHEGLFGRTKVSSVHRKCSEPRQQQSLLDDLEKLSKTLKNPTQEDKFLLQEMVTQTTQTNITFILDQKLKEEGLIFPSFPLIAVFEEQELVPIDSTHIRLTQKYKYIQRDHLASPPEQDTHSFDVVYTLVKENQSRVEFTDWIYHPPAPEVEAVAQQLEANEPELVRGLQGQRHVVKKVPSATVLGQIWNGVKWAATPVTAPAGWLLDRGVSWAAGKMPGISST